MVLALIIIVCANTNIYLIQLTFNQKGQLRVKQLEKLNLIYIASTGRSGSTLLDMLLGSHSQIATAGEIQILPHEIMHDGFMPCGCGKPIPECSFWQQVIDRVKPLNAPQPQIHYFREKHNAGKTLRWKHLLELNFKNILESKQDEIDIYGHNNYKLFEEFLNVTEESNNNRPTWIVDASKDPYRLLWLVKSDLFNIKVLHLVKDPRAFAYSMTRRLLNGQDSQYKAYQFTVQKTFSWLIHNYLISKIAQHNLNNSDYLLVNYEKLASKPEATFKEILDLVGCQVESDFEKGFKSNTIHTIAGNPMRYKPRNIVLDEAWKTSFPAIYRNTANIIASVNKAKYGY